VTYPGALAAAGDFLYLAGGTAGVRILDLTDPVSPRVAWSNPARAMDLALSPPHLVVADPYDLRVYDVTDPRQPDLTGQVSTMGEMFNAINATLAVDDTYAYEVWDEGAVGLPGTPLSNMSVFDLREPGNLFEVATFRDFYGPSPRRAVVDGGQLFIADAHGLTVIAAPPGDAVEVLARADLPGGASDVVVQTAPDGARTVYAAGNEGGLSVLRLVDGSVPTATVTATVPPAPTRVPTAAPSQTATPTFITTVFLPTLSNRDVTGSR